MAFETNHVHEKESHTGAYAAAAAGASLLLAGAVWYATKGRASEALPELEAELGLASKTSGSQALHELGGMIQYPSDLQAAARLLKQDRPFTLASGTMAHAWPLNPDLSVLTPARYPLTIVGDTVHGGQFDIEEFFRMCKEAPGGLTKFDTSGVPQAVGHIPFEGRLTGLPAELRLTVPMSRVEEAAPPLFDASREMHSMVNGSIKPAFIDLGDSNI